MIRRLTQLPLLRSETVRSKILVSMSSVIVIFVLGCCLILDRVITSFGASEVARNVEDGADACARFLGMKRELQEGRVQSIAEAPYVKATLSIPELDAETARAAAEEIREISKANVAFLFDHTGTLQWPSTPPTTAAGRLVERAAMSRVLEGETIAETWDHDGHCLFAVAVPVVAGERVVGAIGLAEIIDDDFARSVSHFGGANVIILRGTALLGRSSSSFGASSPELRDLVRALRGQGGSRGNLTVTSIGPEGEREEWLARVVRFAGSDLSVVVARSTAQARDAYQSAAGSLAIAGALTCALAVLVSLALSSRLSDPIKRLTTASQTLASGDLSVRVEHASRDEIGVLTRSFNHMATWISHLIAEVSEKAERAEAANAAKALFLANISHELRTPLHGVLAFSRLGIKRVSAGREKLVDYFANIERAGTSLLSLVDNLLDLSKLEAGKMHFAFSDMDLVASLESILAELAPIISSAGQVVEVEAPEFARISGDRTKLEQVLRNILANALKFGAAGGPIEISVGTGENGVLLVMRDHGPGIPEEELELIFDQFYQSSRTRTGAGGTGLGLSICRKIVDEHAGTLRAENHPDGGAVFRLEIPGVVGTAYAASDQARGARP